MKNYYPFLTMLILVCMGKPAAAQNADKLVYNVLAASHVYGAASFVVDESCVTGSQRGLLLFAKNLFPPSGDRGLSLDEFDINGNFLSSHFNTQTNLTSATLIPKKIIRSQYEHAYYLLGVVIDSPNPINNLVALYSNVLIKLDCDLNLVWIEKIHYPGMTAIQAQIHLEYNDLLECSNTDIAVVGRFRNNSSSQNVMAAARLDNAGTLLWSKIYPTSLGSVACNTVANSVAEATDGTLCITGFREVCTPPAFTGIRNLLYTTLTPAGMPASSLVVFNSPKEMVGDKIIRNTNVAGADNFFISGWMDAPGNNRQILVANIQQNGTAITFHHIGATAGAEQAHDMIFKIATGGSKQIYLTGFTQSYSPLRQPFFLSLNYNQPLMTLSDFSRYPAPTSLYGNRTGLEIKKADNDKFAILASAEYKPTSSSPFQEFSSLLERDIFDNTTACRVAATPPVTAFTMNRSLYQHSPQDVFTTHPEIWASYRTLTAPTHCGTFIVNPANADPVPGNNDEVLKNRPVPVPVEAGPDAQFSIYPNPVKDQLLIIPGKSWLNEPNLQLGIYSAEMQLIRQERLNAGRQHLINVSALPAGLYFIKLESGSRSVVKKLMKE